MRGMLTAACFFAVVICLLFGEVGAASDFTIALVLDVNSMTEHP